MDVSDYHENLSKGMVPHSDGSWTHGYDASEEEDVLSTLADMILKNLPLPQGESCSAGAKLRALQELKLPMPTCLDHIGTPQKINIIAQKIVSLEREAQLELGNAINRLANLDESGSKAFGCLCLMTVINEAIESGTLPSEEHISKLRAFLKFLSQISKFPTHLYRQGNALLGLAKVAPQEVLEFAFKINDDATTKGLLDVPQIKSSLRNDQIENLVSLIKFLTRNPEWTGKQRSLTARIIQHAISDKIDAKVVIDLLGTLDTTFFEGSRGKRLVYEAVKLDNAKILAFLIAKGVSHTEPHGHIQDQSGIGALSPLRHALSMGRKECAELLLAYGAADKEPDREALLDLVGRTPYLSQALHQVMASYAAETTPKVVEAGQRLLDEIIAAGDWPEVTYWMQQGVNPPLPEPVGLRALEAKQFGITRILVDRGLITPDHLEYLKQKLLQEAFAAVDWPEVAYWVQTGVLPANVNHLATEALRSRQSYLLELLLERGLLTHVGAEQLQLFAAPPVEWAQSFLLRAVSRGISITSPEEPLKKQIANTIRSNRSFSLAAVLVYLGVMVPQDFGSAESIVSHYVSCIQNVSEEERAFRLQLTQNNLAHLLGYSFIHNMTDDQKRGLEGNLFTTSLSFIRSAITHVQKTNPSMPHQIDHALRAMESGHRLALRLEGILNLGSREAIAEAVSSLEKELLTEIEALAVGDSLFIPIQYISKPGEGHALAMMCKKLPSGELELQLINTGQGLKYHGMVNDGSRLHANTVKTHRISLERMQESHTLQALLEVYAASPLLSTKADESYSPSEIYQILAPYSAGDERSIEDFFPESWRKAQLNGTCSMRCLLAYLNQLLDNPADYKRLLDGMKEDSIAFAIEQYKPLLGSSPMTRKLLSKEPDREALLDLVGRTPYLSQALHQVMASYAAETTPKVVEAGQRLLDEVIAAGDWPKVTYWMQQGVNPPLPEPVGLRALEAKQFGITRILVDRGLITPDHLEYLKQKLLQEAFAAADWPEVIYWVQTGVCPANVNDLATEALRGGQTYLLELLLERGFLTPITTEQLQLFAAPPVEWAQSFLLRAVSRGISITSPEEPLKKQIANTIRSNRSFSLAAVLVYLRVMKSADFGNAEPIVSHYVSCIQNAPEEERAFRLQLTQNNLAHLLGDSFIHKMTDDQKRGLEGNPFTTSLSFIRSAITHVQKTNPSMPPEIDHGLRAMESGHRLALRLEGVFNLKSREAIAKAMSSLEKELLTEIEVLAVGDSLFIPIRYTSKPGEGHALAMMCKKLPSGELELQLINTGQGLKYHGMVNDGSRLHANTVKTHQISLERLQESHTLQALLEVYTASPSLSTQADESYSPSELYQILAPYGVGEERPIENSALEGWRKAQLSGTCSMRCLLAYLNQLLDNPAAYKRLLDGIKEDSIAFAIEQYEPLLGSSPMTRKLLSTALPIVLDTLGKRAGDETLATEDELSTRGARLTEVAAQLREALPPLESTKTLLPSRNIPAEIINPAQRRQWKKFVPMAEINSAAAAGPAPQLFEPIAAERIADPKDLIKALDELDAYVADLESKKVCATAYLETSLCAIGRIFIDPTNASLASKTLLEALRADPGSCQRIIGQVEGLSMRLFAASRTPDALAVNPGVPIALRYALATAYELAILAETDSDYAGLQSIESYNPFFWDTFWKSDEPFLSANRQGDRTLLEKYHSRIFLQPDQSARRHLTSEPSLDLDIGMLLPNENEEGYTLAHGEGYDWTEADAEMEEEVERFKATHFRAPEITSKNWRAHWLFCQNKLPAHYYNLRRLAMLVQGNSIEMPLLDPSKALLLPASKPLLVAGNPDTVKYHSANLVKPTTEPISPIPSGFGATVDPSSTGLLLAYDNRLTDEMKQQNMLIKSAPTLAMRSLMNIWPNAAASHPDKISSKIPLLVDHYRQNLAAFQENAQKLFFEMALFSWRPLDRIFTNEPHVVGEIHELLQAALDHYEGLLATTATRKSNISAIAFVLRQQERFLSISLTKGVSEIAGKAVRTELLQTRKKICELVDRLGPDENNIRGELYLTLIDSYQSSSPQDLGEVEELLSSVAQLERLKVMGTKLSGPYALELLTSAEAIPIAHSERIKAILDANPDEQDHLCNSLLKIRGIMIPPAQRWQAVAFPLYSTRLSDGKVIELNVLSGNLKVDGTPVGRLPAKVRAYSAFEEMFKDNEPLLLNTTTAKDWDGKDYTLYECHDQFGSVDIYQINVPYIRRQIDGQTFEYLERFLHKRYDIPNIMVPATTELWQTSDQSFVSLDTQTLQPKTRMDPQGRITFLEEDSNKQYELLDLTKVSGGTDLREVDPNATLLREVGNPSAMRLMLPDIIDEKGGFLEFVSQTPEGTSKPRWVVKGQPHLFLSKNQQLPSIRGLRKYLVLESTSGEREALIRLHPDSTSAGNSETIRVPIKGEKLVSQSPKANAYLAYLALTRATTPEEYHIALEYLKQARKFERYSPEELKILGMLFLSHKETKDYIGPAAAIRLYASYLVQDNLARNPQTAQPARGMGHEWPSVNDPGTAWEDFWQGSWIKTKRDGTKTEVKTKVRETAKFYFGQRSHIPHDFLIENLLSSQELMEWQLTNNLRIKGESYPASEFPPLAAASAPKEVLKLLRSETTVPQVSLRTRPALQGDFRRLLSQARSRSPLDRTHVSDLLHHALQDRRPENRFLATILHAALHTHDNPLAAPLLQLVDQVMNSEEPPKDIQEVVLITAYTAYAKSIKLPPNITSATMPEIPLAQTLPPLSPVTLPNTVPEIERVPFEAVSNEVSKFARLFTRTFQEEEKETESVVEPFTLETSDPTLEVAVAEFNSDYAEGAVKNAGAPSYTLTGKVSIWQLTTTQREAIAQEGKHYKEQVLKKQEGEILTLANKLPIDPRAAVKSQAELVSGRKQPLTIHDCVGLFLQGDLKSYRKKTNLQNPEDIQKLHQMIGNYIALHNKVVRYEAVSEALDDLKTAWENDQEEGRQDRLNQALQKVAEELSLTQAVDPQVDPAAMLVFEYSLGILLKGHQVDGLRKMLEIDPKDPTKVRDILIQRIQGGGKSLVFGHLMALLKADGYHLSIHVPATAQYETALYDMQKRSEQLFGQRERTLVFDDDPLKFTPEYLTSMRETLKEVIVNKEYLTITIESLRALRCKYIKSYFLLQKDPNNAELRKSNDLLNDILGLIRSRGILTFDEVHLALDPTQELNMPFGNATPPDTDQCQLIGKMIRIACTAQDASGKPLLDVKNSHELTSEQYHQLKEQIYEGLLSTYPNWNSPEIVGYLRGSLGSLPAALQIEERRSEAKLLILARQMLVDEWLKEALSAKVNENHGLSPEETPKVSIPYIANMRPALGSEYNQPIVLSTRTLLAYATGGLEASQTEKMVRWCQTAAQAQVEMSSDETLLLAHTPIAQLFLEIYQKPLFSIDPEDSKALEELGKTPLSASDPGKQLMFDYVINNELSEVQIFNHQASSNGQNTASMGQSITGYSASMENRNMAPMGTALDLEKGTNGQTVDRLIRQETAVISIGSDAENLFSDLILQHPQKEKIRAIIDVGAHFRGVDNESAARMIGNKLEAFNSPAKGVLFFSTENGRLCFMHRDQPDRIQVLSGTNRETVATETGFDSTELFTYYDQEHITGVDIAQHPNAIAVVTVSTSTAQHQVLQGVMRLRDLARGQRAVMALPKTAIPTLYDSLNRNRPQPEIPTIRDLLLFTKVVSTRPKKEENLQFALQKISNHIEQFVLDRLYELPSDERRALFAKVDRIFDKDQTLDLFREYANQRQEITIEAYLNRTLEELLGNLDGIFSPNEIAQLRFDIQKEVLGDDKIVEMPSTVDIPAAGAPNAATRNQQGTQVRQQERLVEQKHTQTQASTDTYLREVEQKRKASKAPVAKDLGAYVPGLLASDSLPGVWQPLDTRLRQELPSLSKMVIFDEHLSMGISGSRVFTDRTDLLGPYRKKPWPGLLVCDEIDGKQQYRLILDSSEAVDKVESTLAQTPLPKTRKVWIVRTNGKSVLGDKKELAEALEQPEVTRLFLQAQLFSGDFKALSKAPWFAKLEAWFNTMSPAEKSAWTQFFEQEILIGKPPGYEQSKMYRLLHS